jgi:uncharacterized protein (DUF302 family)
MKHSLLALLLIAPLATSAEAADVTGLVTLPSAHDVPVTADRLVAAAQAKGLKIFARIDHAAGAAEVGNPLAPAELVILGNPKIGTALMQCGHTIAIDLPFKALIWQDADGKVWLSYNTPRYLAERHGITGCEAPVEKASGALDGLARSATE